jgi:hypothetical protein
MEIYPKTGKGRTMLTTKERMDNTTSLTLEERKEILRKHFEEQGSIPGKMTERDKYSLIKVLRDAGYYPPMFDFAMRLLISE